MQRGIGELFQNSTWFSSASSLPHVFQDFDLFPGVIKAPWTTPTRLSGYKIETNSASKYFRLFYGAMDETHLPSGRDVDRAGLRALMGAAESQTADHERWLLSVSHQVGR